MKKRKPKDSYEVFISHHHSDEELAEAVKRCVAKTLGLDQKRICCIGQRYPLRMTEKSFNQITDALREAKVVIALMTPNSLYAPWIWFEAGGGHFHDKKHVLIATAQGITLACLPAPLHLLEFTALDQPGSMKKLCEALAEALSLEWKLRNLDKNQVKRIRRLASVASGDWESVKPALVAQNYVVSPFNALKMLDRKHPHYAEKEVYLISQHAHALTQSGGPFYGKKRIFNWLRADRKRKFHLLITSNIKYARGVGVWKEIIGRKFTKQLQESTDRLKQWVKDAKSRRLGFDVKVADFVPLGGSFVDPDEESGLAILRPCFSTATPGERPDIIFLREKDKDVFRFYWLSFQDTFTRAKSL
jgi:hypothetical protein